MAGTMPLSSHVPASAPIISKIMIEAIAELTLLTMPSIISCQPMPRREATSAATPVASTKMIWLEPERPSSPKTSTLILSATMRKRMGIRASSKVGVRKEVVIGQNCSFREPKIIQFLRNTQKI